MPISIGKSKPIPNRQTWAYLAYSKGDLMVELKKSSEETADNFHSQVKKVLGEQAEVNIYAAPRVQFNLSGIQASAMKMMKKAYGGP